MESRVGKANGCFFPFLAVPKTCLRRQSSTKEYKSDFQPLKFLSRVGKRGANYLPICLQLTSLRPLSYPRYFTKDTGGLSCTMGQECRKLEPYWIWNIEIEKGNILYTDQNPVKIDQKVYKHRFYVSRSHTIFRSGHNNMTNWA